MLPPLVAGILIHSESHDLPSVVRMAKGNIWAASKPYHISWSASSAGFPVITHLRSRLRTASRNDATRDPLAAEIVRTSHDSLLIVMEPRYLYLVVA